MRVGAPILKVMVIGWFSLYAITILKPINLILMD